MVGRDYPEEIEEESMIQINSSNYILKEIPKLHPFSYDYSAWWDEQERRCIEGYWVGGMWIPGRLYFYTNFGTIKHEKKGSVVFTRPELWDIWWEASLYWEQARGFSGFEKDEEFTCDNEFKTKPHPTKTYLDPETYLRKWPREDLGKALYENAAKNLIIMTSRGAGKSFWAANCIVAYNFLFDSSRSFPSDSELISETLLAASEGSRLKPLGEKVHTTLERLPGGQMVKLRDHQLWEPSPLSQKYKGSFSTDSSRTITKSIKVQEGGTWKEFETSKIYIRNFGLDPYSAVSLRFTEGVNDEIGLQNKLLTSVGAMADCTVYGGRRIGSLCLTGTGGDMEKGTIDASIMFNNPNDYNCIAIQDTYEHSGKIGLFFPDYSGKAVSEDGKTKYKDDEGNTRVDIAKAGFDEIREKKKNSKNSLAYYQHIQFQPRVPSEMFLSKKGNHFPSLEIIERLKELEKNDLYKILEQPYQLAFSSKTVSGIEASVISKNLAFPISTYPVPENIDREGCLIVYEPPITDHNGQVPYGLYVIGHDPVSTEQEIGTSLSSIYVLKTTKYALNSPYGYDQVVAEWIGRPSRGRHVTNELLEKLAMWYGNHSRMIYFESMGANVREYFERRGKLHLLAPQADTVLSKRKTMDINANVLYGINMANQHVKLDAIHYTRDYLLRERGRNHEGTIVRNIGLIRSRGLLQELLAYHLGSNEFDRVSAFMCAVVGALDKVNPYVEEKQQESATSRLIKQYLHGKNYDKNKKTKTQVSG